MYVKDLASGVLVLASTSETGVKLDGYSAFPSLSPDASTLAFTSDEGMAAQVYVKDLASGGLVLVSVSDTGDIGNDLSTRPLMSADGRTVAFESSATNLIPADTDGLPDVYVRSLARTAMLSVRNHPVVEGDVGTRIVVFPVTVSTPSTVPVTVDYATADGTAVAGSDYRAKSGTLTLEPGRTRAAIVIVVLGDTVPEPDETFTVELSNPSGATIRDGHAVGTIRNDDP